MKTCRSNGYEISDCLCPECGNKFPIPRRKSCRRKNGHKKVIWCPFCNKKINMKESHHAYL